MKLRTLINQTLTKKTLSEMKRLTVANVAYKLLYIFKNHIGESNSISRAGLFKKVFGRAEQPSLADDLRWDYVKKAMHLCRQRTKCFIGSMCSKGGTWHYFVVESSSDAQHYIDTTERNIKNMRRMQRKATKAVDEKWSSLPSWIENTKQIGMRE